MLRRIKQHPYAEWVIGMWERHERLITGGALLSGFCFDLIFANRPDSAANNILLLTYLLVAGGLIVVLNIQKTRRMLEQNPVEPIVLLTLLQFLFGNLASNLLVLYGRSGTLAGSAIFLALLLCMLIGNEFLKTRYGQLRFTITIYYVLVLSYLVIAAPTFLFHSIGTLQFVGSGVLSLVFISAFLWVVYRFILRGVYRKKYIFEVGVYVLGVFFAFNIFYFLNIIPPVPLGLKDIGIYHSVTKASGGYEASFEPPWWFAFWRATSPTYHLALGKSAYCFSAVFAPTGLSTPVVHSWEFYNEATKKWESRGRISFPINGGREEGYRGFSQKSLTAGKWRCDVETASGSLIGRTTFEATSDPYAPALSQKTL